MKKILTIILFVVLFSTAINAQVAAPPETAKINSEKVSLRAQSVYGEAGGNGILFSVNYDVRFANSQKGLGARIGIGGLANYLTIPFALNYLAGNASNYFEGGLGITYAADAEYDGGHGTAIIFSAGYRYQPAKKGFTARVVLSPLLATDNEGLFFYGGVSFGYKF